MGARQHIMPSAWSFLYLGLLVLAALGSQTDQPSLAFEELAPLVPPELEPAPSWLWTLVAKLASWMQGTPVRTQDASGTTGGLCTGASSGLAPLECTAWQELYDSWDFGAEPPYSRDDPCSAEDSIICQGGSITTLQLAFTSGTIPDSIAQFSSLRFLMLSDTFLTGTIPDSIGKLTAMFNLNLYQTSVSGTLPNSIGELTALDRMDLSNTRVSGTIPDSFGKMAALNKVDFHSTGLSGTIPHSFGQLNASFLYIDLDSTGLSGTVPDSIGRLTGLGYLFLFNTSLSLTLDKIAPLTEVAPLFAIQMNDMAGLTGTIPDSFGMISRLGGLDLHSTGVSGTIPSSIGKVNRGGGLSLDLHNTGLSGSIPTEIGQLTSLYQLDLHNTSMTGTIPKELAQMSSLVFLGLNNAGFSGSIPKTIGQLTSLYHLDLSLTSIAGAIPESFCALTILSARDPLIVCNLTEVTAPACPLPNCPGVLKSCGISKCN